MTQVLFYLLTEESKQTDDLSPQHYAVACRIATEQFQRGKRCLIYTGDQLQAEQVDELLWQQNGEAFVPHNLTGEGPKYGTPVEISWQPPAGRRQVLINLSKNYPEFAGQFQTVIDFVPTDESLKQLARERYKAYRQAGMYLNTESV